jgi:uncharacterized membrane protein
VALSEIIAALMLLGSLGGIIFTALRFRRDDTAVIVSTQSTVVHDIQAMNAELRQALEDCRGRAG